MAHNRATIAFVKKLTESGLVKALKPEQLSTFKRFTFDNSKFNQYGLYRDDLLRENDVVTEALRRIPKDVYHERTYRFTRALLLSTKKDILPKEEWTTLESDQQYLSPYVAEVEREKQERADWNDERVNV